MVRNKKHEVFPPMLHIPCWALKLLGGWHALRGKAVMDGAECRSYWLDRQISRCDRFIAQEIRRCERALLYPRRVSRRLCINIRKSPLHDPHELERLRARDDCEQWTRQLADVDTVIRSRELICVNRCMEQSSMRRSMMEAYLEGCCRQIPDILYIRDKRLESPLFTESDPAWVSYTGRNAESDLERQALVSEKKGA